MGVSSCNVKFIFSAENIKTCKQRTPDFNDCLKANVQDALVQMKDGKYVIFIRLKETRSTIEMIIFIVVYVKFYSGFFKRLLLVLILKFVENFQLFNFPSIVLLL